MRVMTAEKDNFVPWIERLHCEDVTVTVMREYPGMPAPAGDLAGGGCPAGGRSRVSGPSHMGRNTINTQCGSVGCQFEGRSGDTRLVST